MNGDNITMKEAVTMLGFKSVEINRSTIKMNARAVEAELQRRKRY